jgi:hypothetical protein
MHVCSGILPVLKPIFEQADGEVLLALVKHLAVFYNLMPRWEGARLREGGREGGKGAERVREG